MSSSLSNHYFLKAHCCLTPVPYSFGVSALLPYHDWHLHVILTRWTLLAFADEAEGQCLQHKCTHR